MSETTVETRLVAELRGVSLSYETRAERVLVLDGLDLDVTAGVMTLLFGPSGSGKTSLLSCLAGILRPDAGRIVVSGHDVIAMTPKDLVAYRRSVGVVFQAFNLVESLTAVDNVALPLLMRGVRRKAARLRASELLDELGLSSQCRRRPAQLSGGQQQRVAIARALAVNPRLLLADEPTAHLDATSAEQVVTLLEGLATGDRAVVVATHDPRFRSNNARCVQLNGKGGVEGMPAEPPIERRGVPAMRSQLIPKQRNAPDAIDLSGSAIDSLRAARRGSGQTATSV